MRWLWRWLHMITLRRRQRGLGALRILAGNGQTGVINTTLPVALQVQLTDSGGHPVSGVSITWDYQGDGLVDATSTTNALGIATANAALGQFAGPQSIIAAVTGQSLTATFSATATLAPASTIAAVTATSQSATVSTTVSVPPSVRVTDAGGNGVSGQAITWAVASGGGSIDTTGATTTDANGFATLTSWTLGASAGTNTVTATAAGLTGSPVTFLANGTAVVPTTLAINGGNNQTGVVAGTYGADLTVLVTGAGSVPVPGVTVSWATIAGGGLITVTSLTNASGIATGIPLTGTTAGVNTYTADIALGSGALAEVTFTITTVAGAAAQVVLTTQPSPNCASGTALPGQPIVAVQDVNGNTVTSASGTMTATITAGDGSLTGDTVSIVSGVATYTALTITDANGGTDLLHFSNGTFGVDAAVATTVAPPVPDRVLMVTQPTGGYAGGTLTAFSARVADSSNVTIPGYTGQLQVTRATGTGTLGGTTTVNCVNGVATFNAVTYDTAEAGVSLTIADPAAILTPVTTSTFSVTTQGAFNEPPGMTLISHRDMSAEPVSAWIAAGGRYIVTQPTDTIPTTTNGVTISNPGPGPVSGGAFIRGKFVKGQVGGQGPYSSYLSPNFASAGYTEIYRRYAFALSSNWQYGSKIMFLIKVSTDPNQNTIYSTLNPVNGNTSLPRYEFRVQGGIPSLGGNDAGNGNHSYLPSPACFLQLNTWYVFEEYIRSNTAGVADGIIKVWITSPAYNGGATTLAINVSNAAIIRAGSSRAWQNTNHNPTFGFTGETCPDDQYHFVDDIYISGKV